MMHLPIIIDQKMSDRLHMMQAVIADGNFLSHGDERCIRLLRGLFHSAIAEVSSVKRYQYDVQTYEESVLISYIFAYADKITPVWKRGGKIINYARHIGYLLELISCAYTEDQHISVDKKLLLEQVIKFINNPKNYTDGHKTSV